MLERFLFTPAMQHTPMGRLSGGERRRLYLLGILMSAPNILLLDEPTNDLDITTLSILEDYLESFPGPVVAVSHDRYFLDRIAEEIFEVRPGGEVVRYTGNYGDYLKKRHPIEEKPKQAAPKAQAKPRQQKLKFSYMEQREFDTIDEDIADLEEKIAACDEKIAACGADFTALQEAMAEKEGLEAELEAKMERWVYLNDLAEQIAAQG
jgi:ATP-binding cassette subfamily F protein uup